MFRYSSSLSLICFLALLFCAGTPENAEEFCDAARKGTDACNGRKVKIRAKLSDKFQQHPLISMGKEESYWDVNGRDWIFVSEKTIDCSKEATVVGTLAARVGPCDKDAKNKNMYCGTAVYVESWQCH